MATRNGQNTAYPEVKNIAFNLPCEINGPEAKTLGPHISNSAPPPEPYALDLLGQCISVKYIHILEGRKIYPFS